MSNGIDCVIKLGGSAITNKNELEVLRSDMLQSAVELIRQCMAAGLRCFVVHGAGSFGHHHAKEFQVNGGFANKSGDEMRQVKIGFCKTRESVVKLQQLVLSELIKGGIPAVGLSPCGGWTTDQGIVTHHNIQAALSLLDQGFLPVMHGDCVLDTAKGCNILSGDTIIKTLCLHCRVQRVVFLTDVDGIYDNPPETPGAYLIPRIVLSKDGQITSAVSTASNHHDVTGGIKLKLESAVDIVKASQGQTPVFVAKINSPGAHTAIMYGDLRQERGTVICMDDT